MRCTVLLICAFAPAAMAAPLSVPAAGWSELSREPYPVSCALDATGATWCRTTALTSASLAAMSAVIEARAAYPQVYPRISEATVLGPDEFHLVLDLPPMFADRDEVLAAERVATGDTVEYRWWAVANPAVPPVDGRVRLTEAAGSWVLAPEGGQLRVTYTWQAEYGGNLAGWITERIRTATAAEILKRTLAVAEGGKAPEAG